VGARAADTNGVHQIIPNNITGCLIYVKGLLKQTPASRCLVTLGKNSAGYL